METIAIAMTFVSKEKNPYKYYECIILYVYPLNAVLQIKYFGPGVYLNINQSNSPKSLWEFPDYNMTKTAIKVYFFKLVTLRMYVILIWFRPNAYKFN